MADTNQGDDNAWGFRPNRIAPVIFAVCFAATGSWHVWQGRHFKSWKMTLLLPCGALLYVAGLATRMAGTIYLENEGLYIASRTLTLDATAVAAAANYFILGRTLYYIPWASPLDPRRTTQIFITLDLFVGIFITVGLSHVYADSPRDIRLGWAFTRTSLVLQVLLYVLYLGIIGLWHWKVVSAATRVQKPLPTRYVAALYACGVLILIRCIYRTTEYFQGFGGYLARNEAYYYVFDALAILGMLVLLNVFHPGKVFPEDSSVYLAMDGATEVKGPGWSDDRKWWLATVDPLGLSDFCKADRKQRKFWERDGGEVEILQGGGGRQSPSVRTSV